MKATRKPPLAIFYIVSNARGQYLGTYRAMTPSAAIQRHLDGQAQYLATFRSHGATDHGLVATPKAE